MNKDKLRKNEWTHVRLRPIARRFYGGPGGSELEAIDDDWTLKQVVDDGVQIENNRTNHGTTLGFDHIHHYATDPERGKGHGVLVLTSQINIGGNRLWVEHNVRPTSK